VSTNAKVKKYIDLLNQRPALQLKYDEVGESKKGQGNE
jgi:hypothetical protein